MSTFGDIFDGVAGVVTGGAYTLGKTVYQAGKAAAQAGDSLEEVSDSVGALCAVLAKDIDDFLSNLTKMLDVERPVPRSDDELWEEEARQLKALRAEEVVQKQNLDAVILQIQQEKQQAINEGWDNFRLMLLSIKHSVMLVAAQSKLGIIQNAIHEILYNEPGVVPSTIYQVKEILERINTMEQPRIEELLDSANGSVVETTGVLAELKKLFVVETWKAIPVGSLSEVEQKKLAGLRLDLQNYDQLITRNTTLTQEVMKNLIKVHPERVQFPSLAKEVDLADQQPKDMPLVHDESDPESVLSAAAEEKKPSHPGVVNAPVASSMLGHGLSGEREMQRLPFLKEGWTNLLKNRTLAVSSVLQRENVSAFLQNHSMLQAQLKMYERQHIQLERSIHAYEWVRVTEPGVIPQTLDGFKNSINLVNTKTIPGLNSILDEARQVVTKVNQSLGGVQDFFSSLLFKIVAGAFGVLVIGILIFSLVILIRMAFNAFP